MRTVRTRSYGWGLEPVTPQRYCKRPVVVEAVQWDGTSEQADEIIAWVTRHGGTIAAPHLEGGLSLIVEVVHMAGWELEVLGAIARSGDWIIRDERGKFSPMLDDAFRATYEEVSDVH